MTYDETQAYWDSYLRRKRLELLSEATLLWSALVGAGVTEETVLALDFVHFCAKEAEAKSLAEQLSENYRAEASEPGSDGYCLVKGTTRPYGITLTAVTRANWVEFMCDVSRSHGGVFSTWSIEAPKLGVKLSSENYEAALNSLGENDA